MSAKRYSIRGFSAALVEEDNGVLVRWDDYAALQAENERLRKAGGNNAAAIAPRSQDLDTPRMKTYNATEFDLFKGVGLAVHNAVRRTESRLADLDKRSVYPTPPEVRSYCLFGVNPDCSVVPLASGDTSADMKTIVTKPNLALLGKKYGLIGFVYAKTPRRSKEYETLSLPAMEGGRK